MKFDKSQMQKYCKNCKHFEEREDGDETIMLGEGTCYYDKNYPHSTDIYETCDCWEPNDKERDLSDDILRNMFKQESV